MATNSTSDNITLDTLNTAITNDTNAITPLQTAYDNAKNDLSTQQTALQNLNAQYGDVANRAGILQRANKWGGKMVSSDKSHGMVGNPGDYYYVGPNDSQIWGNTAGFNVLNQQYNDYVTALRNINAAISSAQQTVDGLQSADGKSGSLVSAQAQLASDMKALTNFVPLTESGQANTVTVSDNAVQTSAAQEATANANAQAAKDAATTQQNIATSNTELYIIIAVVLIIVIAGVVTYLKFFKKKKAA